MPLLLEPDRYASIQPLFKELAIHLAVVTTLAGRLPGSIYVDDLTSPRAAILIPSNHHRVYVSGEPSPRLITDVLDQLCAESQEESHGCVVYYDAAHTPRDSIEQALQGQDAQAYGRQFYRLRAPTASASRPLPEHVMIQRIDQELVEASPLMNRQALLEEALSESPSPDYFWRQNFGFCAHDGRQFVAWCLAEYHDQGRYELGIETIDAYQRQGIATHLAQAVIERAFALGATEIGWHCWAANTPSVATALRLGFEKARDYPVYYCQYAPAPA